MNTHIENPAIIKEIKRRKKAQKIAKEKAIRFPRVSALKTPFYDKKIEEEEAERKSYAMRSSNIPAITTSANTKHDSKVPL